jgi:hypothetical protein
MTRIHTVSLSDIVGHLPDIKPIDLAQMRPHKRTALFLCALGFEARCLTIPRALADLRWPISRCVYFEFATNRDDNETNRAELLSHLSALSDSVEPMEADTQEFAGSLRQTIRSLVESSEERHPLVILDTSVTSNRLLMRAMKVLMEFDLNLVLLYAEAAIYHPTKQEYRDNKLRSRVNEVAWLDRGVSEVETSHEYPGYHVDQLPDCAMIIPGFNRDRVRAVIHKIDPTLTRPSEHKLLWLVGVPHLPENHWRIEMMREIHELGADASEFEVSTFEYKDTLRTLETLYLDRVNDYRFTIAPMGSKLQALGASLFCHLHPDVRVMFSVPDRYNAVNFSEGCRATWIIEFESLKKSREDLDNVGLLRVVD